MFAELLRGEAPIRKLHECDASRPGVLGAPAYAIDATALDATVPARWPATQVSSPFAKTMHRLLGWSFQSGGGAQDPDGLQGRGGDVRALGNQPRRIALEVCQREQPGAFAANDLAAVSTGGPGTPPDHLHLHVPRAGVLVRADGVHIPWPARRGASTPTPFIVARRSRKPLAAVIQVGPSHGTPLRAWTGPLSTLISVGRKARAAITANQNTASLDSEGARGTKFAARARPAGRSSRHRSPSSSRRAGPLDLETDLVQLRGLPVSPLFNLLNSSSQSTSPGLTSATRRLSAA